ncbi:hypothetical protein AB0A74_02420 [Saccharothrix sp. NPDC042600]|uniref:hypothetical protein n=1 Tax=Saccharothrix TaxID=2071 RepID=UPI0033F62848|nr:hypothetical protein GCM10017745_66340 [Saccharothrix mutabilis subsp. capreolus]
MTDLPEDRHEWVWALWLALGLLWVLAVPLLAFQAAMSVPFMGVPTEAQLARRELLSTWAERAAIAVPLLGLVAAVALKRWTAAIVLGSVLLFTAGAMVIEGARDAARNEPTVVYSPGGCQEHSGGDTRCPGG